MKLRQPKKIKNKSVAKKVTAETISKYLNPTTDIAFKKLFGTQERSNITRDFLNAVLEKENNDRIKTVTIADPANLPETIDKKKSFVDVNCVDQAGKKYIIEMQVINEYDFVERVQYYVSLAVSRQLKIGDEYKKLVPVIFVGVLGFDLDKEHVEALSHHAILNVKTGRHLLRHIQFHFVELVKFKKTPSKISTPVDKWIYFMKNAVKLDAIPKQLNSKEFIEAFHILESAQWTEAELDIHRMEEHAIGTSQRQQQGAREEERCRVALNLLATGIDVKIIAQATGLSLEQIEALTKRK